MRRQITRVKRISGTITAIGGAWGSTTKEDAITEIETKMNNYYVNVKGQEVDVIVCDHERGLLKLVNSHIQKKYLRTDPDKTEENNLDYLPDFRT